MKANLRVELGHEVRILLPLLATVTPVSGPLITTPRIPKQDEMDLRTIVLCLGHNFEDGIVMPQVQATAFGRFGPFRFPGDHAG